MKTKLTLSALMACLIVGNAGFAAPTEYHKPVLGTITDDINIVSTQNKGGIVLRNPEGSLTGNKINIDLKSKGTVGVVAGTSRTSNPVLNLGDKDSTDIITINVVDTSTSASPDFARGLWATGTNTDDWFYGDYSGKLNVNGKSLIITGYSENGAVYGIHAQNNTTSEQNTDNLATININTDNTYIDVSTGENALGEGDAIVAMSQGIVNINSNLEVNADNAIVARGDAKVTINKSGKKTTKLNGDINFNYDKASSGTKVDADVLVNLTGENSYWNGNAVVSWGTGSIPDEGKAEVSGMNLIIADGAQWNPTYVEESSDETDGRKTIAINKLTANDGVINLDNMKNQEVRIENLYGKKLNVNVASAYNKLAITKINDVESLTVAANGAYAEELVQNDINESLNALANQVVDKGEGKTAATDVAISETGVVGEITAQVGEDGKVDATTVKELTNSTTAGIGELANVAFMAWRAENDEMHQRMGELRSSTGEAGIWARMKRGESESGDLNIKNQYSTYQLGYDEKVGDSNWYLGGAISRTEGKSSFGNGSGENQSTGFTVYGTYVGEDGQYVDLSAKYARLDNEFDVFGRDGIESTGDYRNNGYAFSAEYGKRIEAGNEFWVEPQVQLTYGHLSSADYTTSRGIKAAQDAMNSIVGRVGFAAGKDIGAGNVYVKASYLYDFDGDTSVTMNDGVNSRTYKQDLGGGWFEFGIGTNINLSETSHLYFDVERAVGGDIDTPWQWNAGVRFDF